MSVICARISGVLRSSCICWAVKLTTKNRKDTENFALYFRSAGRLRSGERGLLACGFRQLVENNSRRQAADGCRLAACAPRKQKPTLHKTRRLFAARVRIIIDHA